MKKILFTITLALILSLQIESKAQREYTTAAFSNLKFELPVGMTENREKGYSATTDDGLFGVSITQFESNALTKKNSRNMIREMADFLKVEKVKTTDVKYAEAHGVQANGKLNGQNVTMIILNSWGKVTQIVMIYADEYNDAADRYLRSMSKIPSQNIFSKPKSTIP